MYIYKIIFLFFLIIFPPYICAKNTFIETDYGDRTWHGLKHINDVAQAFMKDFNKKNHSEWRSLQPDPRTGVYKCDVPLRTSWKSAYTKGFAPPDEPNYWFIKVSCDKTVSTHEESKKWDLLIPTTRPDVIKP